MISAQDLMEDIVSEMAGQSGRTPGRPIYGTRDIKKRHRRTAAEIQEICRAIHEILSDDNPQSVRHVFYRLTGAPYNLVAKTETGYRTVQRKTLDLRRDEVLPWRWVSDGTRYRRQQQSYETPADAIRHTANSYRRDLWSRTDAYIEVWCESDSMAGVIIQETRRYNVSLMCSRGFSSDSFLSAAAEEIADQKRPAFLYYVGDWDPSGKIIPEVIERRLRAFAPSAEIHFERLLVTPDQIAKWSLQTKPAKKSTHSKQFSGGTVEAEAVPSELARRLVREAIEQHLDQREVRVLKEAEKSEAGWLDAIAEAVAFWGLEDVVGMLE